MFGSDFCWVLFARQCDGGVQAGLPALPLVYGAGQGGSVNYCDAGGWREMEGCFRDGEIFFPISEAKFGLDIARFTDDHADQAICSVGFEKDLTRRRAVGGRTRTGFAIKYGP